MILLTIGLPGHFAEWCDAVVVRLAGTAGREVVSRTWPPLNEMLGSATISPALDEVARALIANRSGHVMVGLRQPDRELRRVLAQGNLRFVVTLDDPREVAADILAETGADAKSVVRALANSCALLMQYDALPGALTVNAEHARTDPAAAVSAIAAHFGFVVEPGRIETIVNELAAAGTWASSGSEASMARFPAAVQKLIDGSLLPYRQRFLTGRLDAFVWKRELFAIGTGASPTEPIDVAGGSRILIFGPYIHLPGGAWTAQVILGFSREAAGYTFMVDVYADAQLAATTFQPDRTGVYSADLTFSLGEPSGNGVEVRVMVTSENARGQLAFGHVVLQPLSTRQPDTIAGSEIFETVLEL